MVRCLTDGRYSWLAGHFRLTARTIWIIINNQTNVCQEEKRLAREAREAEERAAVRMDTEEEDEDEDEEEEEEVVEEVKEVKKTEVSSGTMWIVVT